MVKNNANHSERSGKTSITNADSPYLSEMCFSFSGSSPLSPYQNLQNSEIGREIYPRVGSMGGPEAETVKNPSALLSTSPDSRISAPVEDLKKMFTGTRSESNLLSRESASESEIWLTAVSRIVRADANAIKCSGANEPLIISN